MATTKNTAPRKPADRKPSAAQLKRIEEQKAKEYLSAGLDFSPFVVDAGDGVEWRFQPDISPRSAEALRQAALKIKSVSGLSTEEAADLNIEELFADLIEGLRSQLIDPKQREEFPLDSYGVRALGWFASVVQMGKTGFPT